MVNLSNLRKETTLQRIEDTGSVVQLHRPYLGMSGLGHSCSRYLWYTFRWCYTTTHNARIVRLFGRGDREEPAIIKVLESVGVHVYGDQTEMSIIHGHCRGHVDGIAIGVIEAPKTEHIAEFKTMADKYFKELKKSKLKLSKPVYYAQLQMYMKHLKKKRGLFVSVNKNDDDMYIERVYPDPDKVDQLERIAEDVILSEAPPTKQFKPTWYECKWCDAKEICHQGIAVNINCRTCEYADIVPNGWECSKHKIPLATGQQRLGCKAHDLLEGLK